MKEGTKDTHIYFPSQVLADIKTLATENRRTTTAEIVIAVEEYIKRKLKRTSNTRKDGGR